MKSGNGAFPPVLFAAYRFMVGATVLFVFASFKKIPMPKKKYWKWYVLCGFLQTAYFNLAIQTSLNYINAGLVSVLTYSMPLFFCAFAHFVVPDERLNLRKIFGIMVGIFGLILSLNIQKIDGDFWILMLALSSAVSWALSNLIIKTKLQDCDKIQFTAWQMLVGTVALFTYSFIFENGPSTWSLQSISYLLYSGVLASAFAFALWSHILVKIKASKASMTLLLVPIFGVFSSYLFLHEKLQPTTLFGVACVLLGIWIVNMPSRIPVPVEL
jgi:drug/metabolite transporter (DMT)-like permease